MCVNYVPVSRKTLFDVFATSVDGDVEWRDETWQDYLAPIIRAGANGEREGLLAAYSMVPKQHIPPGLKRFTTMNARSESVGQLRSFASAWKAHQLCLVPMQAFFEPNYESGAAIRWKIGMADEAPFAVAGLYRSWKEHDGTETYSFTQLTINSDAHPLMKRFHKPGDEKRSLVIVPNDQYDDWLTCRDTELARTFFQLYPAEKMAAVAAPRPPAAKRERPSKAVD